MNKANAIKAFLQYEAARDVTTKVWEAMGWPFEAFLRFGQIPEPRATANLKAAQAAVRRKHEG